MSVDIVIPTFNAGATLARTLSSLAADRAPWPCRVVVCDGGSRDDTVSIARDLGAEIASAPRGRGAQLAAGARGSSGWLLFLHADTTLSPGWTAACAAFMESPVVDDAAGYFRLRFDSTSRRARWIEGMAAWRGRALGMPYGDQGLLIKRSFYDRVGGYRPLPLMEDVDLVRRIGRRRLVALDVDAVTSAARYERDGWTLRPMRNLLCLSLFLLGVAPARIARLYGR
ncbi:MAG: TIGR04283 family arsenosugar biosynthesis glycosyltransferase [Rhodospirillales bacterium]|nr:MAG: TIGR04283 family arsenosugar biosynthesis glycosyltransferase [Rhodospirillales bacterium]